MAATPRRIDNNLRDSYFAGVFTTTISGLNTDFQGVVIVDQNGNATGASSVAATTYQKGKLAGTSLTTSYQTLFTASADLRRLTIYNSTDVAVLITVDNGSSEFLELDAYEYWDCDLAANNLKIASGAVIRTKLVGSSAGVTGSVRAQGLS